jgi:hypothetical protein
MIYVLTVSYMQISFITPQKLALLQCITIVLCELVIELVAEL